LQLDDRAVAVQEVRDHLGIVEPGLAKRRRVGDHEQRPIAKPERVAVARECFVEIAHPDRDVRERENTNHCRPPSNRADRRGTP
jgi:hypothetical protein